MSSPAGTTNTSAPRDIVGTTPEPENSGIAATLDVNGQKNQNPIFSLFQQFPIFNFLSRNQDSAKQELATVEQPTETKPKPKPTSVKLPSSFPIVPSLKLEGEESEQAEQTNPVVLWQVYALGGVLVLRWIISRWQERRSRNNPPPSGDDDLS